MLYGGHGVRARTPASVAQRHTPPQKPHAIEPPPGETHHDVSPAPASTTVTTVTPPELEEVATDIAEELDVAVVARVLDPDPLPEGGAPHVVAEPNAVVRPHASERHCGEALCALPMHVRRSWKLAALPFAVAVAWSAAHVVSQRLGVGGFR